MIEDEAKILLELDPSYKKIMDEYEKTTADEQKQMFRNIAVKVYNRVKKEYKAYPKGLIRGLIFFATITDTTEEINAIKSGKINYCANCGWCCDNCDIYLTERDIQKLMIAGIEEPLEPGKHNRKRFKNKPCRYRHKKCHIYKYRPESCAFYPVTFYEDRYIINRKPFCEFTLQLVENRLKYYIHKINLLEQEKQEVNAVLHS